MYLKRLEGYTGTGELFSGGSPLLPVHYDLQVFQEMIDTGLGDQIPGLKRIEGSVTHDADPMALYRLISKDDLVLHMADGQKLGIFIADTRTGRIGNRTGFY